MKRKLARARLVAFGFGATLGLASLAIRYRVIQQSDAMRASQSITAQPHVSYLGLTEEQMIDGAEVIFLEAVSRISRTFWNQDSGEPWEGGLLVHEIQIEVVAPIDATAGVANRVTVTALGSIPLDGHADHDLKAGDVAVFFVRQTELAWRDGRRPVLELMGNLADACRRKGSDGLFGGLPYADLLQRIAQRRAILATP